jgi:hypothetical protein
MTEQEQREGQSQDPATTPQDTAVSDEALDEVAGGFHFVHRANSSSPG